MLLFIRKNVEDINKIIIFQYISCYCLSKKNNIGRNESYISIHLMLLFIRISHVTLDTVCYFNTSHVTVYQAALTYNKKTLIFQYISCYCLSQRVNAILHFSEDLKSPIFKLFLAFYQAILYFYFINNNHTHSLILQLIFLFSLNNTW